MPAHPRLYTDADMPALQTALASWVRAAGDCGYCHPADLPQRIYAERRGRYPAGELVQIWEDNGVISAVALCFRFDTAFDLFTSPALRGTDAELAMLQAAYTTTLRLKRAHAPDDPWVVTDAFACDERRQALLARLGFAQYRLWDYRTERSLAEPLPEPHVPAGFVIRHATPADYAELAAVRNAAFGTSWSPEQYRDEVMGKPGYSPEREIVVVTPDDRIAAFTALGVDALNRVGLFEPVGTHRAFQRHGLARAMMLFALRELRRLGMTTALVQHDASNLPALALYRGLGFIKKHETLGYRRS